ncbi:MAG TPA: glycosyltransferase family 4 protein [Usitatibacter sp.]|nr:glycosyltransferase family 4 protein [Usitatibacter sp.]
MSAALAVFTYDLGASFIDKHVEGVRPGRTVAIGTYGRHPALASLWPMACPALLLDRWALRVPVRLARRAGMSQEAMRDLAIRAFLRRHGVGAVLGEYLDQFLDFAPLVERLRLPYVVQAHGIDVSASIRRPEMAQRYLRYAGARAILTRCEHHRRRLLEVGLPEDKVHVNPGGVAIPPAPPVRDDSAARRLLAIGVMVPKKGPIYLLEAFRRALEQEPRLTLDYIGGGDLMPAAEHFVVMFGLQDRIRLLGFVPEDVKQRLLRECGVFVQHSITNPNTGDEEGLPAAIQEAMAQGMAVVSTRHSGIPEAVVDGLTGLLVDEGDVNGMAAAMVEASRRPRDLGEQGYRRAAELYAFEDENARLRKWLS